MSTIVSDFLTVFLNFINSMFVGLIQLIFQGFLDGSLSPSVTKLDELLNGNVSTITDWFTWLSGGLMGILFVYRLFTTYAYNTMGTEVKSSLRTLLIRTAFCACVLAFVMYFGDFVLDWGMRAYDKAIEYFGQQTAGNVDYGMLGNDSVQDAVMTLQEDFTATDVTDEDPSSVTVFGMSIGNTLSGLFSGSLVTVILIALVIRIACLILCGYNLIKLIVELAQRYMMTMVLYMALPMSLPFYIAVETEQTFFTYQKMFAVEVGVLVLTQAWISIAFYMYSHLTSSLIAIFLFISFVRIGCRMEQVLKDMGLSTASMGGSLFNEVALSVGAMAIGASNVNRSIGSGALNVGAFTNNMKLAQVGSAILGKGVGVTATSRAMTDSVGGAMRAAMDYGSSNPLASAIMQGMDPRYLPDILATAAGKNNAKAMTDGVLKSVYGSLMDANGKVKGYKISTNGSIGKNGMGVVLSNGDKTLQGVISNRKAGKGFTAIPFEDVTGNAMYLNVANEKAANFTADELALGTPDGQAHVENMMAELGESVDADAISYSMNPDGTASVYNEGSLVGIVTSKGEELYSANTDFGSDDMQLEKITQMDPQNIGDVETVQMPLKDIVGTDTGADTKIKIASMFAPNDEKGIDNRINYNGEILRCPGGGSEQFANIVKSNDIKVDSISYNQKTGDFGFDTTTGKHFEFTDACHGYATHNGKIIGNAQTGHYFVKESKSKADIQKKD